MNGFQLDRKACRNSLPSYTCHDALLEHAAADDITAVAPVKSEFVRVVNGTSLIQSQVSAITTDYFRVKNLKIAHGVFFNQDDERLARRVVLLSDVAALGLFQSLQAVGQSIRIKNISFEVIGVLKSTGEGSDNQMRPVYLPMHTAQTYLLQENRYRGDFMYDQVIIQVATRQSLNPAEQSITQTLRARRNLDVGMANDFDIFNQEQILQMVDIMSLLLGSLVGGMGAVSVIVGGVVTGIDQVAVEQQRGANAHGGTADSGDDGFGVRCNGAQELEHRRFLRGRLALQKVANVVARAEHRDIALDDGDANGGVIPRLLQPIGHGGIHGRGKGVLFLHPVDGEGQYAVGDVGQDVVHRVSF